jgi:integrase
MPLAIQPNDYPQRNIQMSRTRLEIEQPSEKIFEQLKADNTTQNFDIKVEKAVRENEGMDSIPMDIYNRMVEYAVSHGKIRNAMFFICMANWGMRISDLIRVKFAHVIDQNGKFRESFSLENGEKKTGKKNRYYNNDAVKKVITMYLEHPFTRQKRRFDYLFTSESGNGNYTTLLKIEREEKYPLETLKKICSALELTIELK